VKRLAFALALAGALASCGRPAAPEVTRAWTRDTVGRTASAAVFMTITAPAGDRLVAASAPIAGKTDLMTMTGGDAAMAMDYVEAIELPAGQPVTLDAGGLHVWLADLTRPLAAGETFPLSLEFEKAGPREVTVEVVAPAAPAPMAGMKM
jgi:copper(I)-binding protein